MSNIINGNIVAERKLNGKVHSDANTVINSVLEQVPEFISDIYANAIKQTKSGTVITIDDATEQELEASTNFVPYPYTETAIKGEFEYNNRQIVINKYDSSQKHYMLAENFALNAGVYTFKVLFDELPLGVPTDAVALAIYATSASGMAINSLLTIDNPETTFTLESINHSVCIEMYVLGYDNFTFEPIVLTDYRLTPVLTKDATEVFVSGKNLFTTSNRAVRDFGKLYDLAPRTFIENSIYLGVTRNNYYQPAQIKKYDVSRSNKVSFTTGSGAYGIGFNFKVVPNEVYTISCKRDVVNTENIGLGFFNAEGNVISHITTEEAKYSIPLTFSIPENCCWLMVVFTTSRLNTEITVEDIQLERTSYATDYEDYVEPQIYLSNANGTVQGIKPINPTMIIYNHSNAEIECTYVADTKKYIDNKFALLTASMSASMVGG